MSIRQNLCNASALWLTVLYAAFCVAVHYLLPQCLDENQEECNTEGYDNSVLAWTTNFFVGALFAVMFVSLGCCCGCKSTTSRPVTSGLAFACLSLAFLSRGFIGLYFPNSGIDDGHGQVGYYLLTFSSYTWWTISSVFFFSLVRVAWDSIKHTGYRFGQCEHKIFFGLMMACFVVISMACGWNALALWNASESSVDDYDQDATASYLPIRLLSTSTLLWNLFYCSFLISSVNVWRVMAGQIGSEVKVGEFSLSIAAFGIVFFQLVNAAMIVLLVLYSIANHLQLLGDKVANSIASVIFNYCMLLTGYLIYRYILAIFPISRNDEKVAETDSDTDEEPVADAVAEDRAVELEEGENQDGDHEDQESTRMGETAKPAEEPVDQSSDPWTSMTKNVQETFTGMFAFAQFEVSQPLSEPTTEKVIDTIDIEAENAEDPQIPNEEVSPSDVSLVEC